MFEAGIRLFTSVPISERSVVACFNSITSRMTRIARSA